MNTNGDKAKLVLIPASALEDCLHYMGRDCRADHHGYCQEHSLQHVGECFVGRMREALEAKGVCQRHDLHCPYPKCEK